MLNILLSCWMIESRTTACAIADLARWGCIYACSELKGAHVIRVPSLFMVTGMVLPVTKRKLASNSRNVIPQSPFSGSLHEGHHFGHSMLVFGDVLTTTLSMIWACLLKWFDPCSLHSITDACLKCCIAWLHRLWHLQFLEYMQCFVSVYPGSPRPNKACCLEYICIALLLSLETVHKSIILDFGQTSHHSPFKRSIDLWSN